MQFNSHSTNEDIVSDINFWITGSATGTTDYALVDKTRNVNIWFDKFVTLALKADNRWEWDDNNQTDLPIATQNLVSGQIDYTITAATFLKLLKVELYQADGIALALMPVSYADKMSDAMTEWQKTNGTPRYYDIIGSSIMLYPAPNYSYTAGLKVYFQRPPSHFTTSDTDKVPGFASIFHRYLSLGAALDYCLVNMPNKARNLEQQILKMEADIIDFYSNRNRSEKPKMRLAQESYSAGDDCEGEESVDWSG